MVTVKVEYEDGSGFSFDVISHAETSNSYQGEIMMVTRGILISAHAKKATAYNIEGTPIAAYYE